MTWNAANKDLLAVGYGKFFFTSLNVGFIYFWSVQSPDTALKSVLTDSPVTALDFSLQQPHLLGVGLYDGTTAVYDVRRDGDASLVIDSRTSPGKHMDPIWNVSIFLL